MKILLILFVCITFANARTIVDHFGRVVQIPEKITKIYAVSPPISMSVLAFDPKLLCALNFPFSKEQKPYAQSAYDKPVAGGFFGQGQTPNFEIIASVKPDVILAWGGFSGSKKIVEKFSLLGIPVILVSNESIKDLLKQFKLYGELTGDTKRADELIAYTKETLTLIDSLQEDLKKDPPKRYYFAEDISGLKSECEGSFHLEPFRYAGATNALDCKSTSNYGMEQISLESVLMADPDLFIVMEKDFYKNIYSDKRFAALKAIKNKEVYLVPSTPFNYITRPPSFMRLMGIRWLIHTMYPDLLPNSLEDEQKKFDALFFKDAQI